MFLFANIVNIHYIKSIKYIEKKEKRKMTFSFTPLFKFLTFWYFPLQAYAFLKVAHFIPSTLYYAFRI